MNVIIASRFRALTQRRDEILFRRTARGIAHLDHGLFYVNREILRQIDVTLSLARRWSDKPISTEYVHHSLVSPANRSRMAA